MDANFNKPEVADEYMVASSTQSPQTKNYLAESGIQVIIINLKWFIIFIILSF